MLPCEVRQYSPVFFVGCVACFRLHHLPYRLLVCVAASSIAFDRKTTTIKTEKSHCTKIHVNAFFESWDNAEVAVAMLYIAIFQEIWVLVCCLVGRSARLINASLPHIEYVISPPDARVGRLSTTVAGPRVLCVSAILTAEALKPCVPVHFKPSLRVSNMSLSPVGVQKLNETNAIQLLKLKAPRSRSFWGDTRQWWCDPLQRNCKYPQSSLKQARGHCLLNNKVEYWNSIPGVPKRYKQLLWLSF